MREPESMLDDTLLNWLQAEDGERAISAAGERLRDPVAAVAALRRVWTREQAAAAMHQAGLRRRAEPRFSQAHRMYFLPEALEQASGEVIARWRARRFGGFDRVADLCCGIGGDTLALGDVSWTVAVDEDALRLALARANTRALDLSDRCVFVQARVPELCPRVPAAFIDPDRRPGGHRTRRLDAMRPPLREILMLHPAIPSLGIKLSPALDDAELSAGTTGQTSEVEFISEGGVCKEAVLWLGEFVTTARRATVLPIGVTLTGEDPVETDVRGPGAFLFEPDAAVIRAHLVEQAAAALGAWKIDAQVALLSGDDAKNSPFAHCFRVCEVLRPSVKEIGRRLRALGYGAVVVKRRASAIDPDTIRRQLQPALVPGSPHEAVVLFTRLGDRRVAFLCERVHPPASPASDAS
jgi:hypothetical protein